MPWGSRATQSADEPCVAFLHRHPCLVASRIDVDAVASLTELL